MENLSSLNEFGHGMFRLSKIQKTIFYLFGFIVFLIVFYFLFLSAPENFPLGTVVKIEPGMSLRSVSSVLKREHIIRSRVVFESFIIIFGAELHIKSANYLFENKLPVWQVARLIKGEGHYTSPISVTIPEGFDINQMSEAFALKLVNFNKTNFLQKAKDKEGYLFPDTYFFLTNADEDNVLQSMSDNFEKKITPFLGDIVSSGKTEKDIITMASIIEREAKGDMDRAVISGILWKRISMGMPLQVDSALDTYRVKGLPDSPIGNPGLLAIKSSIFPQSSPYLYYLHDKNGNIYYAKNFTEHKKNILKYL